MAAKARVAPKTVLAIASLGAAVAFVDATIVNIAFPDIERSFTGTSISSLSWVLNAYNIVFAAFLVAAGRIADIVGRRRMFIFGLEVFTLASLLCAVAPTATLLIGFRVLQALGAACLVPASLALVLNAFPPERRAHGVALLSAVAAAAAGLGPSLGGVLVSAVNWRLVFLVNLPIGVAAILLARRRLVESRAPGRRRLPDLLGALLFAISIAAVVLGVVKGQEWGWASLRIVGAFALAAVAGSVFGWRCSWHRSPIVELPLLRVRTFAVANAMTIVAAAGFYGYTLTNVLYLTGVWRYSVLQAGLALTPGPFVAAAVAGPTSRLVERFGHRPVLVAGGLIWGGAVMWFVLRVGLAPDFLGVWLPGMLLLGVGAGTLFPNLSSAAVASAPGESFGTATGLNSVSRQVGAALGVAIVVAVIGSPSPLQAHAVFQHAWTFGAACLFAAGLGCLFVRRVTAERAPSLADAARSMLGEVLEGLAPAAPSPRSRRAMLVDDGPAEVVRAQSPADFLARVPIFAGLEPGVLAALAERVHLVRLAAGEWLFHAGEPGTSMFIVRAGRVAIVDETSDVVIRELARGDVLGELALLTDSPRSASARAVRDSELLAIDRAEFERLLTHTPAISLALNRRLAEQLRDTRAPVSARRPSPTAVAVLALDGGVPLRQIADGLVDALQTHVSVGLLDEGGPPEPGEDAASRHGPRLDRAEGQHDVVVLCAGSLSAPGPWTEFCLQQADRILAISTGEAPPAGLPPRPDLRGCDLVGLDIPPGSGRLAAWAEMLDPIETHTLGRLQLGDDLARMSRRLTGRSLGIVLSGGGARAFSHIGVLEELTAAGVTIDRVAGVSMGAFVGGLFALGLEADEIDARCFEAWVRGRPLADYTLPRHALIRGERVRTMLTATFGDVAIEELSRSFTSGSGELRSGSLVVHRWGRLAEAVGFSVALPIIGPPQVNGSQILVDGSLVDNLPVETMANLGEGPIIAVDVKATFSGRGSHANGRSGGPRTLRTPTLGETVTRVLLLASSNTTEQARRYADFVITPRVEGVGLMEFHQIDTAREAGRVAARELLESRSMTAGGQ